MEWIQTILLHPVYHISFDASNYWSVQMNIYGHYNQKLDGINHNML